LALKNKQSLSLLGHCGWHQTCNKDKPTNQTTFQNAFKNQFNLFFHVPKMDKWNRYDALNIKVGALSQKVITSKLKFYYFGSHVN
jgi:hypothetical protein